MRFSLFIILVGFILASMATGQVVPAAGGVDQYWPEGEKKIFRFTIDDTEVGRLEAVMDDVDKKDGAILCEIKEKLTLDLSFQERGYLLSVDGRLFVNAAGNFQEAEVEISVDDRREETRATYDTTAKEVVAHRDDENKTTRTISAPDPVFAVDNYMLDQWELALAMHALAGGKRIVIPGFSVQGMYATECEFLVLGKVQMQYGAFTDSVWQVDMLRPAQASVYVDRKHRIVKVIYPDQDLVAELLVDPFAQRRAPQKSLVEIVDDQMIRMPIYGLYLFITLIWLLFLGRDSYRTGWSYILFVVGGLVYPIIYITQAPLQQQYAVDVLGPALAAGESIIITAIFPALLTGLIQESLKFIPLFIVARLVKPKPVALISMGAFIGAGFGFVEAGHIVAPAFQERLLTGYMLIERVFTILSHTILGAVLGYGLARKKIWQFWLIAAGLHGLANYMVIFVQMKILTIKGLNIILGLYDIALLAGTVFLQKTFKRSQQLSKKVKR